MASSESDEDELKEDWKRATDRVKAGIAVEDAELATLEKEYEELDQAFEEIDRATAHLEKFKPGSLPADEELIKAAEELKFDDEEIGDLEPEFEKIMERIENVRKSYEQTLEIFNKCDGHVKEITQNIANFENFCHDKKAQKELDDILKEARKNIGDLMTTPDLETLKKELEEGKHQGGPETNDEPPPGCPPPPYPYEDEHKAPPPIREARAPPRKVLQRPTSASSSSSSSSGTTRLPPATTTRSPAPSAAAARTNPRHRRPSGR